MFTLQAKMSSEVDLICDNEDHGCPGVDGPMPPADIQKSLAEGHMEFDSTKMAIINIDDPRWTPGQEVAAVHEVQATAAPTEYSEWSLVER